MGTAGVRAATAAAGVGVLLVGMAAPAAAARPQQPGASEVEHFVDHIGPEEWLCWSPPPEDPEAPGEPDFVLEYEAHVRVTTAFRQTGRNDAPGFHDVLHGTDTWTLVTEDGQTHVLTHVFNASIRDRRLVDQGTTLLITAAGAGNDTWYLDGERIARNPGMNVVQFQVLHGGTLQDPTDDQFVEGSFQVVKPSTGLNEMPDLDPCAVMAQFVVDPD